MVLWTCKVLCGSFYAPYIILYSFNKKCFHTVFCALFKPKSLWSQPIKHRLGFSAALCCVMALSLPQYQQVFCNSKNKTNKKEEDEEEEEEGQQQQVWNTSRLTALYKARNYMPACLCGVMRLLQVQEQWLTVPDLVTAVRCLPKATADSSRLGDNNKVFVKSNSWQFQTWWQQQDFVKSNGWQFQTWWQPQGVCQKQWLTDTDSLRLSNSRYCWPKVMAYYFRMWWWLMFVKYDGWQIMIWWQQ